MPIGRRGLPGLAAAAACFVAGIKPARPEWMTDVEPTTEPVLIIDARTYRRDAERVRDAVERMKAELVAVQRERERAFRARYREALTIAARNDRLAMALQDGLMTRDELRRIEGLPLVPS